jgi:hypothetical protein
MSSSTDSIVGMELPPVAATATSFTTTQADDAQQQQQQRQFPAAAPADAAAAAAAAAPKTPKAGGRPKTPRTPKALLSPSSLLSTLTRQRSVRLHPPQQQQGGGDVEEGGEQHHCHPKATKRSVQQQKPATLQDIRTEGACVFFLGGAGGRAGGEGVVLCVVLWRGFAVCWVCVEEAVLFICCMVWLKGALGFCWYWMRRSIDLLID